MRQPAAHGEEDKAADEAQMQSGDRQQVLTARNWRNAVLTSSEMAPRLPVISAEATPPVEPGSTAMIRRDISVRRRRSRSRQPPPDVSSAPAMRCAGP